MNILGDSTDLARVYRELDVNGATIFPNLLPQTELEQYARVARNLRYTRQAERYGARQVRQEVASVLIGKRNPLSKLADQIESSISSFFGPTAFSSPFSLNNRNVQRYPHQTFGIGAHQDESINCNLVVLLALSGWGDFCVYRHKEDTSPRLILPIEPNTLLLMRAPGFLHYTSQDRPIHGVRNIVGGEDGYRYVLGMRTTYPRS